MSLYFSPASCGFYDSEIHGSLPDDAREITLLTHQSLLAAQSAGKIITTDANDNPVATDAPAPEPDELLGSLRARRDRLLTECDWTQVLDSPLDDAARAEWAAYRQALRDLPANTPDPATVAWPDAPARKDQA